MRVSGWSLPNDWKDGWIAIEHKVIKLRPKHTTTITTNQTNERTNTCCKLFFSSFSYLHLYLYHYIFIVFALLRIVQPWKFYFIFGLFFLVFFLSLGWTKSEIFRGIRICKINPYTHNCNQIEPNSYQTAYFQLQNGKKFFQFFCFFFYFRMVCI